MLHSRLRPAPRQNVTKATTTPTALAPDFRDENESLDATESPEDLFGAFLPYLFPDDTPSFHGDPGQHLIYSSPRYGELEIMIPSYPGQTGKKSEEVAIGLEKKDGANKAEQGRQLFAHFLWSAAMVVAEGVENADRKATENDSAVQKEAREIWSVHGETVMELGAGKFFDVIRNRLFCSLMSSPRRRSALPYLCPRQCLAGRRDGPPFVASSHRCNRVQPEAELPPKSNITTDHCLHPGPRMGNPHRLLLPIQQGNFYPHHRRGLLLDALAA